MKTNILYSNNKMEIGYKKICNCPSNHINCLTPKEWARDMVGIWEFYYEKRDIRDKNVHPAVFPIALPAKCIKLFTHEGELVLDPFVGIGSTLVAAKDLNRNAIGFDLKQEYIDVAKERLIQSNYLNSTQQIPVKDDACNIHSYLRENTVALAITSPPYSKFLVGAALLCSDGKVFIGCNIENASYGLTICAEQSAICSAITEGCRDFVAIAVLSPSEDDIITPCGNCRQVLAEFNDDIQVICANQKGDYKSFPLSELLPFSFQLNSTRKSHSPHS